MFTSAVIKSNQNLMLAPDRSGDPFMALHPSKCQMSCPHEVVLDICLPQDSRYHDSSNPLSQTLCLPSRNAAPWIWSINQVSVGKWVLVQELWWKTFC